MGWTMIPELIQQIYRYAVKYQITQTVQQLIHGQNTNEYRITLYAQSLEEPGLVKVIILTPDAQDYTWEWKEYTVI